MGSDSDSSNVKSMAPMVGLKLQVSHSRAVFMSTAILVLGMNGRSQCRREKAKVLTTPKLADHAAAVLPVPARARACRNLGHLRLPFNISQSLELGLPTIVIFGQDVP